jgi:DNA-binding transcriptional ArsR family regulator
MDELDRTLAALADPARRRTLELLRAGPRRPGELADALHLSRPAMSRHLRALRDAGLVAADELADDARGRLIRVRPEPLAAVRGWVSEMEAFWTDRLSEFAAYAESKDER